MAAAVTTFSGVGVLVMTTHSGVLVGVGVCVGVGVLVGGGEPVGMGVSGDGPTFSNNRGRRSWVAGP
jgi:hypothetical protein